MQIQQLETTQKTLEADLAKAKTDYKKGFFYNEVFCVARIDGYKKTG